MRPPFFSTPERRAALTAAVARWEGTPFAHNGTVPGIDGGVSCHGLVWGVLASAGWVLPEPLPIGRADHARHSREEIMLPWLRARPQLFQEITPAEVRSLQPGDVMTHRFLMCSHHLTLATADGRMLEVWGGKRAGCRALGDADTTKRLTGIFRPLEITP